MAPRRAPEPSSPQAELWRRRGRLLLLGGVLAVLGAGAVLLAAVTTLFSVGGLGAMLLVGGAVQALYALRFWRSHWATFVPALLAAVLYLVCGVLLVAGPAAPAAGITLLMAAVLMAGGALRLLWSLGPGVPGRAASIAHGAVTLLLGVLLWAIWPATSLWAVGIFVGADLLAAGAMLVYLACIARRLAPRGA
jgi:uncharacterized membrane protein HdeD (DUF308 family)